MPSTTLGEILSSRNGAAIIARLRWIDDRFFWVSRFRRKTYAERFRLSVNQVTADLALYVELSTTPPRPDRANRQFDAPEGFVPLFDDKNLDTWLSGEVDHMPIAWEEAVVPSRWLDSGVLAAVLRSSEDRVPIKVTYSSMGSGISRERILCPHTLVRTGGRYHVRAWDDHRSRFADFVIGRISSCEPCIDEPWVEGRADADWHSFVAIEIKPHPDLEDSQRDIVRREWQMVDDVATITTRAALVSYTLDALHLLDAVRDHEGVGYISRGIACANAEELGSHVF